MTKKTKKQIRAEVTADVVADLRVLSESWALITESMRPTAPVIADQCFIVSVALDELSGLYEKQGIPKR